MRCVSNSIREGRLSSPLNYCTPLIHAGVLLCSIRNKAIIVQFLNPFVDYSTRPDACHFVKDSRLVSKDSRLNGITLFKISQAMLLNDNTVLTPTSVKKIGRLYSAVWLSS